MKSCSLALLGALLCASAVSAAQPPACAIADPSFEAFLPQFEQSITRFINGDNVQWKQHASHGDDAMIMGAWGAYEKGWPQVNARYDWAAARFRQSGAAAKFEYLACGASGDLAYTVAIERSVAHLADKDTPMPMVLRVNHIFRKEHGVWKLLLRHADPLISKTAPDTVLKP